MISPSRDEERKDMSIGPERWRKGPVEAWAWGGYVI